MQFAFYDPKGNHGRYSDDARFTSLPRDETGVRTSHEARLTTSAIVSRLTQTAKPYLDATHCEAEITPGNMIKDYNSRSSVPNIGHSDEHDSDDDLHSLFSEGLEFAPSTQQAVDQHAIEYPQSRQESPEDHLPCLNRGTEVDSSQDCAGGLPEAAENLPGCFDETAVRKFSPPDTSDSKQNATDHSITSGSSVEGGNHDDAARSIDRMQSPCLDQPESIVGSSGLAVKHNKPSCCSCVCCTDKGDWISTAAIQSITDIVMSLLTKNSSPAAYSHHSTLSTSVSEKFANIQDSMCHEGSGLNDTRTSPSASATIIPVSNVSEEQIDPYLRFNQYPAVEPVAHVLSADIQKPCSQIEELNTMDKVNCTIFQNRDDLSRPDMTVIDPLPDSIRTPSSTQPGSRQGHLVHGRFTCKPHAEGVVYCMTWLTSGTNIDPPFPGNFGMDLEAVEEPPKRRRRARYSLEDDDRLIELRNNKLDWNFIQEHFPGRTVTALQMRYSILMRKRQMTGHDEIKRKPHVQQTAHTADPTFRSENNKSSRPIKRARTSGIAVEIQSRYPKRRRDSVKHYKPEVPVMKRRKRYS